MIREDFLQFGWKTGLFLRTDLFLTDGRKVDILNKGILNNNDGPDFSQAKIKIEDTIWAGNIEIHVKSSDWKKHKHQLDPAYNNVILHVVWENDTDILLSDGSTLPCIELRSFIEKPLLNSYLALSQSLSPIPCQSFIKDISPLIVTNMLERAVIHRLENKTNRIKKLLTQTQNDWNFTLFVTLCRYFGFKVNADPFEELALRLPFSQIGRLQNNKLAIEAMLLGTAGLIPDLPEDPYLVSLKSEFEYLQKLHNIKSINPILWKFGKLRPHNFPYIRIAQLASLLTKNQNLFSVILDKEHVKELYPLLDTDVNPYWIAHYKPSVIGKIRNSNLAKKSKDLLIINCFVPIVFNYGLETGDNTFCDKALQWLEQIQAEKNHKLNEWENIGVIAKNCMESQGLLELMDSFCIPKKCLQCSIGYEILKKN
jgi:hypothetical protein